MSTKPSAPTFEHYREALGIGEAKPRISWKTQAEPDWSQDAYEVEVVFRGATITSGRVESQASVLVPWPGPALGSRERASVRVRVWGNGAPSVWSEVSTVEAGLLKPSDWEAVPVGPAWPEDPSSDRRRPPLVRRPFTLSAAPLTARLYVTAHGLYEVELNGHRVGCESIGPGWTHYRSRLKYATYDVTALLVEGANAIGAWLGDGWYRGRLAWDGGHRNVYGRDIGLIAQLEVTMADGNRIVVATDGTWRAGVGPILSSGLYDGERYDAREEQQGWSSAGFDDSDWSPVALGDRDPGTLVAVDSPPVRCTEEVAPIAVLRTPRGKTVLDFGQNLVGRVRARARGERGTVITMSTAELMQDGEIYTRTLRTAVSTDEYIMAGRQREEWEPRFTLHGFRYVQVDGWPGDIDAAAANGDLVARVYHTDMERTGWFECSDPLVNRLHENVVWGMRGNFVDVPTDCPQRDERLGWTGDIQVFAPTAAYLFDCTGMLGSWLRDLATEQREHGTVPLFVPVVPTNSTWRAAQARAVWGDAAVLVPWALYQESGDVSILERQFESAKAWVDQVECLAGDDHVWDRGQQLGDWLDPTAPPDNPAAGATDPHLVATAYFAWSSAHVALIARALGRTEDADHYARLAEQVREAFGQRYGSGPGRLTSDSQTAYALAIRFGLLQPAEIAPAGQRLAELVAEGGYHIGTGFAGTPVITDALTMAGEPAAAYQLLLQRDCPSWLYGVTVGATTIWERWDALRPDGSVNPGEMTSFNHYAFGAIAAWLHSTVAGLAPASPGYREILFRPRPGPGITSAAARHESPYGTISISWELLDGQYLVRVTIPTGATAWLDLDGHEPVRLGPGSHERAFGA
ncbi:MAG TPA: family 78 glycoside hydrolase catalytic domain [Acidimicrobiales bacterium]|nr:family 78 glycoside hydrolase catalytic domain [Acidimicrobiales bacterium]